MTGVLVEHSLCVACVVASATRFEMMYLVDHVLKPNDFKTENMHCKTRRQEEMPSRRNSFFNQHWFGFYVLRRGDKVSFFAQKETV